MGRFGTGQSTIDRWRLPALPALAGARLIRIAGVAVLAYGRPQAVGYVEHWTPIRYVTATQTCHFCWRTIPKGSPGSRVGERGTRAWWEKALDLWECCPCHDAATAAELASSSA